MINILFISLGENMFGTEKFIYYLMKNLPKDKFRVYWGIPYESKLSKVLNNYDIDYFDFKNNSLDGFKIRGLINIARFIIKNNIDIVHSNSGVLPCVIGKILSVKRCFETRHGIFYSDKQLKNFSRYKKYHENIKQYFVNYQIAIAENDKIRMINYFGIRADKIRVIYYGVDIDDIRKNGIKCEDTDNKENKLFQFVNIGRFTPQKAQLDLLRAANLLKEEYQRFHLTIIGEGEDREKLLTYINTNSLQRYVKVESYKEDIHKEILKYDALVMTSRFEGVPYVVSDSMALGVPIVHTDVGGISNVIRNDIDGLIVQVGNIIEIKDAMRRIATDNELYRRIQTNAFNRIEEFSIQRMVNEYEKLYLE